MIISEVSVVYAEVLNAATSAVTLQGTDRQGILGEKSADFQVSLRSGHTECAPSCSADGTVQE